MNIFPKITKHPIRCLLYLEWILLIIIAMSETLKFPLYGGRRRIGDIHTTEISNSLSINLFLLLVFSLMGLFLPINKSRSNKIIYTTVEISLIILMSFLSNLRLSPILCIILVIRDCFIFERKQNLIINIFVFSLFTFIQIQRLHKLTRLPLFARERFILVLLSSIILFGLVIVFLQLLVKAIMSERKSREQLAIANEKLRQYALKIENIAALEERNRIAREIHDSLGHYLTVLNVSLEAAWKLRKSEPQESIEFLADAKQLGSKALNEVRQSVADLRSNWWENQSLELAIATLIADFHKSTGILPASNISLNSSPDNELKIAVYRIVQEALTNIYKYAEATTVEINIFTTKNLHLIIQDNGKGFNLNQNTTGFGLQGMQERALALGGKFEILTSPNTGCKIIANFPLVNIN
ncbi:MAG: sensor histidine kinase [Okeania sp. SIO2G4]|uniref:sensor histidine kinase n=1 Tax=unclassified Okeania TaxID=2634635 RepID=UPI0013BCABFB|nr:MULTISPECIES: sensor histidine kinase [unclassified Okeania]NEP74117.1 sensor histidine kinase [Okeania sp. SIO2G5]NEP95047.1 sensor histidine kinase [Okeania sp. SIO2F5]NEQ92832.1 sensor histidine kinase [Okeania sp. SIO2G4]